MRSGSSGFGVTVSTWERLANTIWSGRVRPRENKKRRKNSKQKKGARPKFDAPWREPKALIIFEFNEPEQMVKKQRQRRIDGTLLGPDHLAELVALQRGQQCIASRIPYPFRVLDTTS